MTVILVKNEEELTKLRDEDGGPKRIALWECEGEGVEGWITDGCKFYLQRCKEWHESMLSIDTVNRSRKACLEHERKRREELESLRLNPPMFPLR